MNERYYTILGLKQGATAKEIRDAYRLLARRWHPDRFQEGPERIWAEQRMIEINQAYNALIVNCRHDVSVVPGSRFMEVRLLIEAGQLSRARQLMCAMDERSAEWNYHFGIMLFKREDYEKASVYLHIALRQSPENAEYKAACDEVDAILNKSRVKGVLNRIGSYIKSKAAKPHAEAESE